MPPHNCNSAPGKVQSFSSHHSSRNTEGNRVKKQNQNKIKPLDYSERYCGHGPIWKLLLNPRMLPELLSPGILVEISTHLPSPTFYLPAPILVGDGHNRAIGPCSGWATLHPLQRDVILTPYQKGDFSPAFYQLPPAQLKTGRCLEKSCSSGS